MQSVSRIFIWESFHHRALAIGEFASLCFACWVFRFPSGAQECYRSGHSNFDVVPLWPAGCEHLWVEWVWLPLLALPQNGLGSWVISPDFWAISPAPVGLVLSLSVFLCIRFFVLLAM